MNSRIDDSLEIQSSAITNTSIDIRKLRSETMDRMASAEYSSP